MNVVVVQPDGVLVSAILDVVSKDRRARSVEVVGRVKTFDQVCSSEFFPPVDTAPDEKPANTEATKAAGVFSIFLQDSVTVDAEGGVSAEDAAIGNFGYEFWWTSGHIFSVLCHSPFLFLSDASTCAYPPSLPPTLPLSGLVYDLSSRQELLRVEFIAADFGPRLPDLPSRSAWPLVYADPVTACTSLSNPPQFVSGSFVVVER